MNTQNNRDSNASPGWRL